MTQPLAPSGARGLAGSAETRPGAPAVPVEPPRASWAGLSWATWAVGALTLLAAALRFSTLGEQSYWYNEAATVVLMKASFGDMISRMSHVEGNPPLYYVLAWSWTKVFGAGEVGLRSLSALAGTAMVPAAYAATRRLAGVRPALVVAALASCSPLLVWFSQEARPYAMFALLAALTMLCFARVLQEPSPRRLAAWGVVCALSLATHYFSIFVVAPQAIWLLVNLPVRRRVLAALALPGVVAAALLPIALNVSEPAKTSIPGSFGERLVQLPKQLLVGFGLYSAGERAIVVSAGLLVLLGAALVPWLGDRLERRGALVAGALGVAGVVAVLLLAAVGLDYLNTRNMIGLWLPFAIVASCGLGARAAGRWGVAAAVALCALSVGAVIAVDVHRPYQRDDWRGAVRALGRSAEPRVIVATPSSATVPFEVYLPRATVVRTPAVTVREIDLLALALRSAPGHEPEPPAPTAVSPMGFRLVSVRRDRMFTVLRYRAAASVSVPTAQLVAMRLQGVDAAVELDP